MFRNNPDTSDPAASRWPHRLAWVLAATTFLLIFVGATVTTYRAGMAVPDWPTTDGSWFYPIQQWLAAAWDFFLEHAHRMLAQLVGLVAIALAVALWTLDRRKWMRLLAVALVVGVVFQGTLGGLRVLADSILLAKIHGCTAPLFFALSAALVTLTSRRWLQEDQPREHRATRDFQLLTLAVTVAVYGLIVLGAQLRHLPPDAALDWFELWTWRKLKAVGLVAIGLAWLLVCASRRVRGEAMIVRRTRLLIVLFVVQLFLGAGAWLTNYGWPGWFRNYIWQIEYTIVQEGPLQVWTRTSHAAVGSLNLIVLLALSLWSRRLLRDPLQRDTAAREYWRLIRPGIVAMVLAAMAVAAWTAGPTPPTWPQVLHALLGTAGVIAGAVALNQRLEFRGDAKMPRTAKRPLPAGRLTDAQVTRFGAAASAVGMAYLVVFTNWTVPALAAVSWILYVWVYTPLKSVSPWQTPVGAVAGAMPILLGAAVTRAPFSPTALVLFGIVYLWQFPHAMAIAWLYRREFAAGGVRLATVVDPSGRTAGIVSVLGAAALLPVSLVPWFCSWCDWKYALAAALLAGAYLAFAIGFLRLRNETAARWLLRASLLYLLVLLAAWLAA